MKDLPLTVAEVNLYGSSIPITATNQGGYGGIGYGSTNEYVTSYIKIVVDAWVNDIFQNDELKEVNGYSARLLTKNEYNSISSNNNWRLQYRYWIMPVGSDTTVAYCVFNPYGLYGNNVCGNLGNKWNVRPVINIYKSALETNNNE